MYEKITQIFLFYIEYQIFNIKILRIHTNYKIFFHIELKSGFHVKNGCFNASFGVIRF